MIFLLAMNFPSAIGYEVALLMMPRIGGKETNQKKPTNKTNPKPFNFSLGHSPAQKICNFFWKGKEMLVIFKHCLSSSDTFLPMFAVLLSTSWTCDTSEEYVSSHHIWQNFGFWDFKLIPRFYIAVSVCLGSAWKLLLCSVNSNPIL